MALSKFGPEELEHFLSVYDRQNQARQLVREPAYAAKLKSIYGSPRSSAGGYTYGSALAGQKKALQGLATGHAGLRAMEQVQTDLQKDADRRHFITNQAALDQRLEDWRGRNIGAFANLLTQAVGHGTSPIRPGGDKHGEFKQAMETAGQNIEAREELANFRRNLAAEDRQRWIDYIQETKGRAPNLWDWDTFHQMQRNRR